jgi:hypothetical protein|tara:strand:+ start:10457 stop:10852 length:396 start_codon:yes stop_codon:yes gene_type:complete
MSKLKNIGVVSHVLRLPMQDYSNIITYYNLQNEDEMLVKVFNNPTFDIFGYLPPGFFFSMPNNAQKIMDAFNKEKNLNVVFANNNERESRPFFIKKTAVTPRASSVDDILGIANDKKLNRKVVGVRFIYEH